MLMKDHLSLIAAAAGGFMFSIAAAGIIKAAPVISLNTPPSFTTPVANFQASFTASHSEKNQKR